MSRKIGFDTASSRSNSRTRMWDHLLGPDEDILWEGRPGFGVKFDGNALKSLVIVSIGIAILGPQLLGDNPANRSTMDMLNVPYFGIGPINGAWLLGGAMVWTLLWFLSQIITTPFFSRYMLSDRRAFIAKTFLRTRIKSYELSPLRVVEFDGKRNGSIVFATETRRAERGRKQEFPVGFMHVDGAEALYRKMLDIQRKDTHEPS